MGTWSMYDFMRLNCIFKYVHNQIPLNALHASKCYVHMFLVILDGIYVVEP